jgi:drug/metabolite transporter (DMT)-like permease
VSPRESVSRARGRGILLALVSAAGFSTLGIFAKLIYAEGFSLPQTLAWRFTIASVLLWAIIGLSGRRDATRRPPLGKRLVPVMLLGVFGYAPQAGLYFLTLKFLDPGIASLLLYLYPSCVILLSFIVFRQRPNRVQLASLALAIAGCVVTFFKPGSYPLVGLALGALCALTYGAYLVASERVLEGVDSVRASAVIMLESAVVYWIASASTGTLRAPSTLLSVAGIIGVALFASALPVTAIFAAMREIGAADSSLLGALEPVLTVVLSALILGERLGPAQALGGALILGAILVLRFAPAKRNDEGTSCQPDA